MCYFWKMVVAKNLQSGASTVPLILSKTMLFFSLFLRSNIPFDTNCGLVIIVFPSIFMKMSWAAECASYERANTNYNYDIPPISDIWERMRDCYVVQMVRSESISLHLKSQGYSFLIVQFALKGSLSRRLDSVNGCLLKAKFAEIKQKNFSVVTLVLWFSPL